MHNLITYLNMSYLSISKKLTPLAFNSIHGIIVLTLKPKNQSIGAQPERRSSNCFGALPEAALRKWLERYLERRFANGALIDIKYLIILSKIFALRANSKLQKYFSSVLTD